MGLCFVPVPGVGVQPVTGSPATLVFGELARPLGALVIWLATGRRMASWLFWGAGSGSWLRGEPLDDADTDDGSTASACPEDGRPGGSSVCWSERGPLLMWEPHVFYLWVLVLETREAKSQAWVCAGSRRLPCQGPLWWLPVRDSFRRRELGAAMGPPGPWTGWGAPVPLCPSLSESLLVLASFPANETNLPREPAPFPPTALASRPEPPGAGSCRRTSSAIRHIPRGCLIQSLNYQPLTHPQPP